MGDGFSRAFVVRWADLDFNGHMKNTAYLDVCGDVRMMFFEANGFSMREFERRRVGPVIVRDEVEYFREMRLLEPFVVDIRLAGMSEDAVRFRIRNAFAREDGKPVARVTSTGGWFDLAERRLVAPPDELAEVIRAMPRTDDFETLPPAKRP